MFGLSHKLVVKHKTWCTFMATVSNKSTHNSAHHGLNPIRSYLHQLSYKRRNWTSLLWNCAISPHFLHVWKPCFHAMKNLMHYGIFVTSLHETRAGFVKINIPLLEIKTSHELWGTVVWCMFIQMQHNQ